MHHPQVEIFLVLTREHGSQIKVCEYFAGYGVYQSHRADEIKEKLRQFEVNLKIQQAAS